MGIGAVNRLMCWMRVVCFSVYHARFSFFFFFNDTATTEIYTLSLHDALPISSNSASERTTTWLVACACDKRHRVSSL